MNPMRQARSAHRQPGRRRQLRPELTTVAVLDLIHAPLPIRSMRARCSTIRGLWVRVPRGLQLKLPRSDHGSQRPIRSPLYLDPAMRYLAVGMVLGMNDR
jgi:hypothetical protein